MAFQIEALDGAQFDTLFNLSDAELQAHHAVRETVRDCPGTPCRVSLADAAVGEEVILVNYQHQPAASPYRASHAIYVRRGVKTARLAPGEVPAFFRHRLVSLRGFDAKGMMLAAEAAEGDRLEQAIEALFANSRVETIHLHFAKPGCFAATVRRDG